MRTLMKTASALAIAVAAGLSTTSGFAADLGGNCCTDLEERVAELEATTARKGNRKMSLQVYGSVSEAIVWWNDGAESNVYVLENNNIKNTLGVRGSAKITSDWSAGYRLEMQIRAYRSSSANQLALGTTENVTITAYNTQSISLRFANWYLKSNTYGTITVGLDTDAATGTGGISLVNPGGFAGPIGPGYVNQGMFLRRAGTTGTTGLSALSWFTGAYIRNGASSASFDYAQTGGKVKYTSPFFLGKTKSSGFQFSANWGMDDYWTVALRYAEEFNGVRFAAGVGYSNWTSIDRGACSNPSQSQLVTPGTPGPLGTAAGSTVDCNSVAASASILHVPTGLYVSGGGGVITDDNRQLSAMLFSTPGTPGTTARNGIDDQDSLWWVQAGWQAKLNPLGSTIFWGQYVNYNVGMKIFNNSPVTVAANDVLNSLGEVAFIAGSDATIWGGGITQNIDAAAMQLYLGFYNFSNEITLLNRSATATNQRAKSNPIDDFSAVYTGATIRF